MGTTKTNPDNVKIIQEFIIGCQKIAFFHVFVQLHLLQALQIG